MKHSRFTDEQMVIPPFLTGLRSRIHAAIFSFCAGVTPPMPILGRSLLYVHMWTAPTCKHFYRYLDRIACFHMCGLSMWSHMTTGQDDFRNVCS